MPYMAERTRIPRRSGGDVRVVWSDIRFPKTPSAFGSSQAFCPTYTEMRMTAQIANTIRACYYQLRSISQIKKFLSQDAVLKLTGGSDAKVLVENELKIDASGGSQIYVDGDPHIDANLSGGSKVHQ